MKFGRTVHTSHTRESSALRKYIPSKFRQLEVKCNIPFGWCRSQSHSVGCKILKNKIQLCFTQKTREWNEALELGGSL